MPLSTISLKKEKSQVNYFDFRVSIIKWVFIENRIILFGMGGGGV